MKRVYYHHEDREECQAEGMWRIVAGAEEREKFVKAAADLMANPPKFRAAMMRAITEWPRSCETNMTARSINHQAWFGHAGCFLATGSPEDCTRLGWHTLTDFQQAVANRMADEVIEEWWARYRRGCYGEQPSLFDA